MTNTNAYAYAYAYDSKPVARVVGGGFVGLACALELQADGFHVQLFDASADSHAASWGNAGHIATEQLAPLASWHNVKRLPQALYSQGGPVSFPIKQIGRWMPFGMLLLAACQPSKFQRSFATNKALLAQALPAWASLLARVGESALLSTLGHRLVWESPQSAARGLASWLSADLGSAGAAELDQHTLRGIAEQFAGKPVGGLQFSGTGHIRDLRAVRFAMREAFVNAGGVWHRQSVSCIRLTSDGAKIVATGNPNGDAVGQAQDLIVLCAGVHSADVLHDDFGNLPMIAERGYHLQLEQGAAQKMDLHAPIVFEDRSMIITPFLHGLRLASFTEFSRADAPEEPGKWRRLEKHANELGIDTKRNACATWMGSRPTLPDYMPAIGRSTRAPNLILACGHNHLGLTLAAVTGQLVRQLARRDTSAIDISALAPQRYLRNF